MRICCVKEGAQANVLWQPRGVGWEGHGREAQERGDMCIPVADLWWCVAEANTIFCKANVLQYIILFYTSQKKKWTYFVERTFKTIKNGKKKRNPGSVNLRNSPHFMALCSQQPQPTSLPTALLRLSQITLYGKYLTVVPEWDDAGILWGKGTSETGWSKELRTFFILFVGNSTVQH